MKNFDPNGKRPKRRRYPTLIEKIIFFSIIIGSVLVYSHCAHALSEFRFTAITMIMYGCGVTIVLFAQIFPHRVPSRILHNIHTLHYIIIFMTLFILVSYSISHHDIFEALEAFIHELLLFTFHLCLSKH